MNFDRVANVYDPLARLVFGRNLVESKMHFLSTIPEDARILILGGGTGVELEYLTGSSQKIVFVEPSTKMIEKAKNRNTNSQIQYFNCTFDEFKGEEPFDVFICHYFFDLFSNEKLNDVINKINSLANDRSLLIVADFNSKTGGLRLLHQFLLKAMYAFFYMTVGLQAFKLPAIEQNISNTWRKELYEERMNGFIWSAVYSKESARPLTST